MSRIWLGSGSAFPDEPEPADFGFKAWSGDPGSMAGTTAITAGVLHLTKLWLRSPQVVTGINWNVGGAGATLTNVGVALYNAAGTTLITSVVNTGNATTAQFQGTGLKTIAISQALAAGQYYVGIWTTGTTQPSLARGISGGATMNAGTTLASGTGLRFAVANTGLTTTAPSTFTQTTNAGAAFWAALS